MVAAQARISFLKKTLGHVETAQKEKFRDPRERAHRLVHPHRVVRGELGHYEFDDNFLRDVQGEDHLGNGKTFAQMILPDIHEKAPDQRTVEPSIQRPGQQGETGPVFLDKRLVVERLEVL